MNGTDYCGFADWGSCADLAQTGSGDLWGWVVAGFLVIVVGLLFTGRGRD